MTRKPSLIFQKLDFAYVTCLGLGLSPKMPGTVGSFAAIFFWLWWPFGGTSILTRVIACVILTIIAVYAIRSYESRKNKKDNSEVVIDELVGMGFALLLVERNLIEISIAFALFRLFDVTKPPGVRYFDDNYLKGWGVMLDDVVAGLYACLCIGLFKWLVP
jgi:phosphatidylglycerophosphatase A